MLKVQPTTLDALGQAESLELLALVNSGISEYISPAMLIRNTPIVVAVVTLLCLACVAQEPALPTPGKVYRVCSETETNTTECAGKAPKLVHMIHPEYSDEARQNRIQGTVVMAVTVTAEGGVQDATVEKSLGYGLDEKALEAVRRWQFEPATINDNPVSVRINVQTTFRMYASPQRPTPGHIRQPRR